MRKNLMEIPMDLLDTENTSLKIESYIMNQSISIASACEGAHKALFMVIRDLEDNDEALVAVHIGQNALEMIELRIESILVAIMQMSRLNDPELNAKKVKKTVKS